MLRVEHLRLDRKKAAQFGYASRFCFGYNFTDRICDQKALTTLRHVMLSGLNKESKEVLRNSNFIFIFNDDVHPQNPLSSQFSDLFKSCPALEKVTFLMEKRT